ncbi:sugar phosphate isomerase/epimerase family protein [Geoglobus sp.]
MKLGFQPDVDHSLEKAFEFGSESGFSHVEILMDHPNFHYEVVDANEVMELSMSYDLDILIHASAINTNFLAISSEIREASYRELENTMIFAERCDAKVVTVHIGWNPGFITARGFVFREEWYDRHNERVLVEEFLPFAERYETLAIENTIGIKGGIRRGLEEILSKSDVKLTFDVGHHRVKEGHDLFLEHFERVVNVHLHDNRGEYDEHLSLGAGDTDFSIIPKSYGGYLTLELRDEDAIVESKEFVLKSGLWM